MTEFRQSRRMNTLQPPLARPTLVLILCFFAMTSFAKQPLPEPGALPSTAALPDPLMMFNGAAVRTANEWNNKRRPELKELFQTYMYGHMPSAPKRVQAKVERVDEKALGGKATMKQITLTMGPGDGPKVDLLLFTPNGRKEPAPIFVGINFYGNHEVVDDPWVPLPKSWVPKSSADIINNRATEK